MYNPGFSIFELSSGIIKKRKTKELMQSTRKDEPHDRVRSQCWWCHSADLWCHGVYVCKCTCVCFHLCARVCNSQCLLLLRNAEPHFWPNFRSRLQLTKTSLRTRVAVVTCSYQLVMKFKQPVVVLFKKKKEKKGTSIDHSFSRRATFTKARTSQTFENVNSWRRFLCQGLVSE